VLNGITIIGSIAATGDDRSGMSRVHRTDLEDS
jgi:hypothetical protein